MFKWLRKGDRKKETLKTIDTVLPQLMAEIMNDILRYDVKFSYPRDGAPVPASRIISDLERAGYDIPTLICDILSGRIRPQRDCEIELIKKW